MNERSTTSREITVRYLENLGPSAAVDVTLPAGTAVERVNIERSWAVADIPLLIRLTGNAHDPHYRYCMVPDDAVAPPKAA